MNIILTVKLLIFFLLILFCLFQINKLITNIQTSENYFIDLNTTLCEDVVNEIKNFISKNLKKKYPTYICKILKENFPIIDFINIERSNSDLLKIKIIEYKPLYKVNSNLIYTKNGLFPKNYFANNVTNNFDQLFTDEQTGLFLNFVKEIPRNIVKEFEINWKNKNFILLKCKNEQFTILITSKNTLTENIINVCKKLILYKQLKDENRKYVLDLRFSGQLIVC